MTHTADSVPYLLFDSTRAGAGGVYTEPATAHCAPVPAHELMGRLVAVVIRAAGRPSGMSRAVAGFSFRLLHPAPMEV